jgi:hypothetical protein
MRVRTGLVGPGYGQELRVKGTEARDFWRSYEDPGS